MPVSKRLLFVVAILGCFALLPQKAHALGLVNASASATTSRPSASSPLNLSVDPLSIGSSGVTVFNNNSTYLSSDSAKFFDSGAFSENVTIATTSADKLTASFTTSTTVAHGKASVLTVPITAMHVIAFSPQTAVPIGGKIVIQYPALASSDTNQASPSANSWVFNGLNATTDIQMKTSLGAATCSWGISGNTASGIPTLTCTTATAAIPAGATVWVFVGCTAATADAQGGRCTTQRPLVINPTNTGGTRGTASVKSVGISTQDGSSNILDQSTVKMGTIESVFVVAHVDPTFSFNIDGVAAGTDMHTSQTCSTSYANISTNASFASTPTEVNLGTITSAGNTYAAQKMTLRSNTGVGYAITATSSGFLINPANGSYIVNAQGNVTGNNTPAPTTINTTTGGYGINPCDANSRVSTSVWGQGTPNFANPSPNFYYTLVNYAGAPDAAGDVIYSIYGVRAGGSTPPGDYWQIITYTASVTF